MAADHDVLEVPIEPTEYCHPVWFHLKPSHLTKGSPLEYKVPVLLKNKGSSGAQLGQPRPTLNETKVAALCQVSGKESNLAQLPQYPTYAKLSIKPTDRSAAQLSVHTHPNRTLDLRTNPVPLLPRQNVGNTGLGAALSRAKRHNPDTQEKTIARFVEECHGFYKQHVPKKDRMQELDSFVQGGGVQPIVLANSASSVASGACAMSMICLKDDTNLRERGAETTVSQVELPALNAAPLPDITDKWAQEGGDPECIPLGLNDTAIAQLNSLLSGITVVERTLQHRTKTLHTAALDKERGAALMKRGYALMAPAIGNAALSGDSRVYVDRFNPTCEDESTNTYCMHPLGGVQQLDSLSTARGFSSSQLRASNPVLDADEADEAQPGHRTLPVLLLDPVALFQFDNTIQHNKGIGANVYIRTHSDMNHIIQNPHVYGAHLHACVDNRMHSASNEPFKLPVLARCKNYDLHYNPIKSVPSATNVTNSSVVEPDIRFLSLCQRKVPATSNRVGTKQYRALQPAPQGRTAAPSVATNSSYPYSMSVHCPEGVGLGTVNGGARGAQLDDIDLFPNKDWVCGVARSSGTLLVQTDAPDLDVEQIDRSERTLLKDTTNGLFSSAHITLRESAEMLARTGHTLDNYATDGMDHTEFAQAKTALAALESKIQSFDSLNLLASLPHQSQPSVGAATSGAKAKHSEAQEFLLTARALEQSAAPLNQMLQTVCDIHSLNEHITEASSYMPCRLGSLSGLEHRLGSYRTTLGIVGSKCAQSLQAAMKAVKRCLQKNDGSNSSKSSYGRFSKIKALLPKHQARFGQTKDLRALASYSSRACVLARNGSGSHKEHSDDWNLLCIDRTSGTDPEYFSTDPSLADLPNLSSMRSTLATNLCVPHDEVLLGNVYKLPVYGKRKCHTARSRALGSDSLDQTVNGHQVSTLAVEWKLASSASNEPFKTACVQVNTNVNGRVRSADSKNSKIECNPEFGFHLIQAEM